MKEDELMHYGVKGMKWGKRKAQTSSHSIEKRIKNTEAKNESKTKKAAEKGVKQEYKSKRTKAVKAGAAFVGASLATYGAYKASKYLKSEAGRRATQAGIDHLKKNIDTGQFIKIGNQLGNIKTMNSKDWGKKVNRDLKRDVDIANRVSSSAIEAAKYLYNNRKR